MSGFFSIHFTITALKNIVRYTLQTRGVRCIGVHLYTVKPVYSQTCIKRDPR